MTNETNEWENWVSCQPPLLACQTKSPSLLKARLKLLPEADREKVLARRKRFLAATTDDAATAEKKRISLRTVKASSPAAAAAAVDQRGEERRRRERQREERKREQDKSRKAATAAAAKDGDARRKISQKKGKEEGLQTLHVGWILVIDIGNLKGNLFLLGQFC